jgi:hypothetical protein
MNNFSLNTLGIAEIFAAQGAPPLLLNKIFNPKILIIMFGHL